MTAITRRIDHCGCGCQGDDSWHARTFHRELVDIREEVGTMKVHAYTEPVEYQRVAWARLPWGEGKLVRVVEVVLRDGGQAIALGWFSTREIRA